jgi:hypothetical protein
VKALAASLATAAVLAGGSAPAASPPPLNVQIAAVNAAITKLDRELAATNKSIATGNKSIAAVDATLPQLTGRVASLEQTSACLRKAWDAVFSTPYLEYTTNGFPTLSGNVTMYVAPAQADGLIGSGYLLTSATVSGTC